MGNTWGELIRAKHATIALLVVLVLCVQQLAFSYYYRPMMMQAAMRLDPAMVFHSLSIDNPVVPSGEPLQVSYSYDKRSECTSGSYSFHALIRSNDGTYVHFIALQEGVKSLEPAGVGLHAKMNVSTSGVPIGIYALEIIAVFMCQGEQAPQVILPAFQAPFSIVD